MNKLITKARSGVTLVELLVVILIVTILSVSMLPLLQPFVTEAQYAAEAIPVIGNLRTKIGLYIYEKNKLPYDESALQTQGYVETWTTKQNETDIFVPARYKVLTSNTRRNSPVTLTDANGITTASQIAGHIQGLLDVDYQDLKGKRSKPLDYQYVAICTNAVSTSMSYAIACFGSGKDGGLKAGTGYAVCELHFPTVGRKYIGTWKRYKSYNDAAGAIAFSTDDTADNDSGKVLDCYIPKSEEVEDATTKAAVDGIINAMLGAGWEF